nr:MAG TPA_asm: hypothetical protein [Caudoviricetes sp.]
MSQAIHDQHLLSNRFSDGIRVVGFPFFPHFIESGFSLCFQMLNVVAWVVWLIGLKNYNLY